MAYVMRPAKKRLRKKPMAQRMELQRQMIARYLLLGWNARKIARRLGCQETAVRYAMAQPEFAELFQKLQSERLSKLDGEINEMLFEAVTALRKQLKHRDQKWVDAAIEKVFLLHGRYVQRIDVSGSLLGHVSHQHAHGVKLGVIPDEMLSDEQRVLMRQLLASVREPRALPTGMRDPNKVLDVTPVPEPVPVPVPQEPPAPPSVMKVHRARL
jgi:hypothetical protein